MNNLKDKAVRGVFCATVMLALSACAPMFTNSVDVADGAEFGDFSTFAWITEDRLVAYEIGTSTLGNPINDQRVRAAVEQELAGKGYRKVPLEEADLAVAFTINARNRVRINEYYNDFGYNYHGFQRGFHRFGHRGSGVGVRRTVRTFTDGIIVVDIFDNRSKDAIWHGVAAKQLTRDDRENAKQLIDTGVAGLLTEFPNRNDIADVMKELMS